MDGMALEIFSAGSRRRFAECAPKLFDAQVFKLEVLQVLCKPSTQQREEHETELLLFSKQEVKSLQQLEDLVTVRITVRSNVSQDSRSIRLAEAPRDMFHSKLKHKYREPAAKLGSLLRQHFSWGRFTFPHEAFAFITTTHNVFAPFLDATLAYGVKMNEYQRSWNVPHSRSTSLLSENGESALGE